MIDNSWDCNPVAGGDLHFVATSEATYVKSGDAAAWQRAPHLPRPCRQSVRLAYRIAWKSTMREDFERAPRSYWGIARLRSSWRAVPTYSMLAALELYHGPSDEELGIARSVPGLYLYDRKISRAYRPTDWNAPRGSWTCTATGSIVEMTGKSVTVTWPDGRRREFGQRWLGFDAEAFRRALSAGMKA